MKKHFPQFLAMLFFWGCQPNGGKKDSPSSDMTKPPAPKVTITKALFGTMPNGQSVDLFTLRNPNGMEVKITNYGGIITHLYVPDRNGKMGDVVLGFDSLSPYLKEHPYFGAIVGRYGNRIAKGQFSLDKEVHKLATNNGPNHLHGGLEGFDKKIWQAEMKEQDKQATLSLYRVSPDGEEGYPGELHAQVEYSLNEKNELRICYAARVFKKNTHVNLTNHAYFNLTSDPNNTILGHELQIKANGYIPVGKTLIPTGKIASIEGSPFDFRTAKTIGRDIEMTDEQLQIGGGYDHCFVLEKNREVLDPQLVATIHEPTSGRVLEVLTTEPGMQFYTGNFLDGTLRGKRGITYQHRTGFCLETQHFPDSPNQLGFPSTLLKPNSTYRTTTVYRFSVRERY